MADPSVVQSRLLCPDGFPVPFGVVDGTSGHGAKTSASANSWRLLKSTNGSNPSNYTCGRASGHGSNLPVHSYIGSTPKVYLSIRNLNFSQS